LEQVFEQLLDIGNVRPDDPVESLLPILALETSKELSRVARELPVPECGGNFTRENVRLDRCAAAGQEKTLARSPVSR